MPTTTRAIASAAEHRGRRFQPRQQQSKWMGRPRHLQLHPHFGVTADFSGNSQQLAGVSFLGFSAGTRQHIFYLLLWSHCYRIFRQDFGLWTRAVRCRTLQPERRRGRGLWEEYRLRWIAPTRSPSAFGGGVDIGLTRHFAIRAAQVDFIRTNFNSLDALGSGFASNTSNSQNSFRYSGGIIWRF